MGEVLKENLNSESSVDFHKPACPELKAGTRTDIHKSMPMAALFTIAKR